LSLTRSLCALALGAVLAAAPAHAHDRAAGRIDDERRQPVPGALVTVSGQDGKRAITVYTDELGRFVLPDLARGTYDLRVRHAGHRDLVRPGLTIGPETALPLRVETERDPAARAAQLPPNRWLGLLLPRLSSDAHRDELVLQCTFCHQEGNPETRAPRDAGTWSGIVARMAEMGGSLSPRLAAELPAAAVAAYEPAAASAALAAAPPFPRPQPDGAAAVTEWIVGEPGAALRDLAAAPDGAVWAIDMMRDRLHRFDPASGNTASWDVPDGGAPLGGDFAAGGLRLPAGAMARSAPESLRVAPDGGVWIALAYRSALARFDPASAAWTIEPLAGRAGRYPQTLRVDASGRLWYTLALDNAVGMFDPGTRTHRRFGLPARSWLQALFPFGPGAPGRLPLPVRATTALPMPSGLEVAPDGGVWFSQLDTRRIGRIDPVSGRIRTYDAPFTAPRALRFDGAGGVWMTGAGVVARLDPTTTEFRTWPLPIVPPGAELAYGLDVDRRTDAVWITGTNSDALLRFERWKDAFTVFPLPTPGTAPRALAIDAAGNVWTGSGGIPPWKLADRGARLLRLEPAAYVR
jgi:streptogramin lyase